MNRGVFSNPVHSLKNAWKRDRKPGMIRLPSCLSIWKWYSKPRNEGMKAIKKK